MNLSYTHELLAAADEQPHGFIKLRGSKAEHEVKLMAQAGLVEASFSDDNEGAYTSINRLTPAGETFLRASKPHHIPDSSPSQNQKLTVSQAAVVAKWKSRFDLRLLSYGTGR